MNKARFTRIKFDSGLTRTTLVAAQLLALGAYVMGLRFLIKTTGGTLFFFATIAPVLVAVAVLMLLAVLVYRYLRRHSLFDFETYDPGEVIFRAGEEGDSAYFIHEGEFAVIREENGTETVIARLSSGQYFGEMALISNAARNATVRAVTPAKVAVLGKNNFLTMLKVMPWTQEDIMKKVNERAMRHSAAK